MSSETAAIILCVLLAGLALFQLALAFGAPLGRFAFGGAHERLPIGFRIGSLVSIAIYALISLTCLDRAGVHRLLPEPDTSRFLIWIIVGFFALGVAMNAISRSKLERNTMAPLALVLFVLTLVIALSPRS